MSNIYDSVLLQKMVDGMPLLTVTLASKIIPNKKQYKERERECSVTLYNQKSEGPFKSLCFHH